MLQKICRNLFIPDAENSTTDIKYVFSYLELKFTEVINDSHLLHI